MEGNKQGQSPETMAIDITPEQATALHLAVVYYMLWLDSHHERARTYQEHVPLLTDLENKLLVVRSANSCLQRQNSVEL